MGKRTTDSQKSNLHLSVARISKHLKKRLSSKVQLGKAQSVYLTAFVESMVTQFLTLANEQRLNMKPERKHINVEHIAQVGQMEDQPLKNLLPTRVAGEYVE